MTPLSDSQMENVPQPPRARHGRHRKHDHLLNGNRHIVHISDHCVGRHHHQQKHGRHRNPRQIRPQKRMLVHKSSYRWYSSAGTTAGKNHNTNPAPATRTQSHQGTRVASGASLASIIGHKSRGGSASPTGSTPAFFSSSFILLTSCSLMAALLLSAL